MFTHVYVFDYRHAATGATTARDPGLHLPMPRPRSSTSDSTGANARALERIASRLHDEFAHVDTVEITERLTHEYAATSEARIQAYRLVLAERATRKYLSIHRRDPRGKA
jgi:hypothetical protein